jgi:hypothetical protein
MVGGEWGKDAEGNAVYQGGKWIEVIYSRPMLRQRTSIFGSGAEYGVAVRAGTPLWRAGANQTTVLKTEVPLVFGGTTVPAAPDAVRRRQQDRSHRRRESQSLVRRRANSDAGQLQGPAED